MRVLHTYSNLILCEWYNIRNVKCLEIIQINSYFNEEKVSIFNFKLRQFSHFFNT